MERRPSFGDSRWAALDGDHVHYLDFGGPPGGPVVIAVHGLGGSVLNWLAIAPLLTGECRLLAPDLAGHGLTRTRNRCSTVAASRLLLDRFVEHVAGGPVILMGNSMGGMVSLLEAAERPETVAGLILLDAATSFGPALPAPMVAAVFALYTAPWLGAVVRARRWALTAETAVGFMLRVCCADPSRVPPDIVAEHVRLTRHRAELAYAEQDFLQAARSVVRTAAGLSYRAAIRSVRAPALLVHGDRDLLVPVAGSRALVRSHPSWQLVILGGVGHTPQMEAPRETADAVSRWLGTVGAVVEAARHPLAKRG
ncbi:alpha/beta hydrolase [Nonomuraea sp. PA05]|uniref:alpha/beta fold hydrolase n=1 Tax=Nonomuraea sp. PA05 TaxID=2604466 RepID=UPI0011D631AE|nr:alpha/beta hydrolase [Nonomuraea sp. PA05]TYB60173.1 alpha/beta hydrolase [Nonomuraea sp. PA05]